MINPENINIKKNPEHETHYYNIGDALNMPWYWDKFEPLTAENPSIKKKDIFPNTILARYMTDRPLGEPMPNLERLHKAVDGFICDEPEFKRIFELVKETTTLTAHIRSGDYGKMSNWHLKRLQNLSTKFKHVIVFAGVHNNQKYATVNDAKKNVCDDLNSILTSIKHAEVYLHEPDTHMYLMKHASNLFVHTGGFSLMGSLLTSGKVYYSNELQAYKNAKWLKDMEGKSTEYLT